MNERQRTARDRFAAYLDQLDQQTRLPAEKPLREAVAEQARERLLEMARPCLHCGTWVGPNENHRCENHRSGPA